MHPIIREVIRRVEEQARLAGIEVSDMMFLTRAEAQVVMKQFDIEAMLLDNDEVDTLLDNNPRLLAAFIRIDLIAKHGKGGEPLAGNRYSKDVTTH